MNAAKAEIGGPSIKNLGIPDILPNDSAKTLFY
jgi:hypothetical protein